jgi:translation initiation factor 3 subunit D
VYSYKLFTLGDGMRIVIRCALETVATVGDSERVALVRSLLEHEGRGTDWRGKLDSAKGAVIVTEIRNNACKMAKWTAQAVLAGADGIRVGFVARQSPKNPSSHVLLGTNYYRTKDFASSINLNMNNAWGIIKALLISFAKLGDGKFLFLKDPTKPILRLYAVPKEYFESVKLD